MTYKPQVYRKDLIEPQLSFEIVGLLFETFNELGPGLHEKMYEKGLRELLTKKKLPFREQVAIPLQIHGKVIGRYFADFIVAGRIVLELKKGDFIKRSHAVQLLAYLKATNLPLGMLAYFGNDGVTFKRIVNKDALSVSS